MKYQRPSLTAPISSIKPATTLAVPPPSTAPVVSRTVSRIAPMLGVRPDKRREPNLAEVLPFVHETEH